MPALFAATVCRRVKNASILAENSKDADAVRSDCEEKLENVCIQPISSLSK